MTDKISSTAADMSAFDWRSFKKRMEARQPKTLEGYAELMLVDIVELMSGYPVRVVKIIDPSFMNEEVRAWGREAFPDFRLSAEQLEEAAVLSVGYRKHRQG